MKQARQIVLQDLLLRSYSTFKYILSSILRNKRVREHLSQNSKGLQPLKGNAGGKTAGDEGKGLEMRPHHLKAEGPVVKQENTYIVNSDFPSASATGTDLGVMSNPEVHPFDESHGGARQAIQNSAR